MTRLATALVLLLALTGLSACTPQADMEAGIGSSLQENVASIATAAAEGDPSTAMTRLDALEQAVLQATAEGRITSARAGQIAAAIELVRRDLRDQLETLHPAESTTAPTEMPANSAGNGNGNGKGNGKKGNGKKGD